MAKRKVKTTYTELLELATEYGVENNALFINAAKQYELQMQVVDMMRKAIDGEELTCQKTYLAGEKNTYANPLIKELPRHTDSANKTLMAMLEIINKLGKRQEKESALSSFAKEFS
jgi:hypothetical protein